MTGLGNSKPIGVIGVKNKTDAKAFYADTLGLEFLHDDGFASVFRAGGMMIRVSTIPDFKPHNHSVIGFDVPDIESSVTALTGKGVKFNIYEGFGQDARGIWTAPGGQVRVAWFNDPDGNVLSLTQFS
jgi:catechol 2,3-dioxygenase-like lactoylglutathione lyase family enzyme